MMPPFTHLNDYTVCDLTLLHFNTSYKPLINTYIGSDLDRETVDFTLNRICFEIEFKLNEYIKNRLKATTQQNTISN